MLQRQRVAAVLHLENTGGEGFLGVVLQDRHGPLDEDGAVVEFGADEVDGAAVDADASLQGTGVGVEAFEGGQERGMDVEEAVLPALHEPGAQDAHETRQADEPDAGLVQFLVQRPLERLTSIMSLVIDNQVRNARRRSYVQTARPGPVGDDECDLEGCFRLLACLYQGSEIGTAP